MVRLGFFQFNFEDFPKFKSFDMFKLEDSLVTCFSLDQIRLYAPQTKDASNTRTCVVVLDEFISSALRNNSGDERKMKLSLLFTVLAGVSNAVVAHIEKLQYLSAATANNATAASFMACFCFSMTCHIHHFYLLRCVG
ncbi:hypothetical protein T07_14341 [Trichinella nelsoni]|uniref:Uncharacterized protein n=1 Tax=Trichinella nelsoni TaxID=6336 RepID=A0A0V0SBB7_9BILA|nr:hypothetical protein T07_14341 [Trichinella nelsoni]